MNIFFDFIVSHVVLLFRRFVFKHLNFLLIRSTRTLSFEGVFVHQDTFHFTLFKQGVFFLENILNFLVNVFLLIFGGDLPGFRVYLARSLGTCLHVFVQFVLDSGFLINFDYNSIFLDIQVVFGRELNPLVHEDDASLVLVVLIEPFLGVFGVLNVGAPLS